MRRGTISIPLAVLVAMWLMVQSSTFREIVASINGLNDKEADELSVPGVDDLGDPSDLVPPVFGAEPTDPDATTTTAPASPGEPGDDGDGDPFADVDLDPLGVQPGLVVIDTDPEREAALGVIDQVRVAGRGPKTGYDRDEFGSAWTDDNDAGVFSRNGCDTRNDILRRDLADIEVRPNTDDCVIVAGTITDPYTGSAMVFEKAQASKLQVDHMVPLSLAWQMGAARWEPAKRIAFANDPLNLVLVDGPTNGAKGDKSIASWLPPNKSIRCSYALRMAQVSIRYDLPTTNADKDAMVAQCA